MNDERQSRIGIAANSGHDLRTRTKRFALRVIRLYSSLANGDEKWVLGKQMLRSGTSVGAHYREAYRARSTAEFVSKIEGGLQELEETLYWIELLVESGQISQTNVCDLTQEANELVAIFVASAKTAKSDR